MAIFTNTEETRLVESLVWEQASTLGIDGTTVAEAVIADTIVKVKAGQLLLKGQMVTFNPMASSNACAVTGIISEVTRTSSASFSYKVLLLIGDVKTSPTYATVLSTSAEADLDITNVSIDIITGMKATFLGYTSLLDMKRNLKIDHVYRYITANTNFISYF